MNLEQLSNLELQALIKAANEVLHQRPAEPLADEEVAILQTHYGARWAEVMLAYCKRTGLPKETAKTIIFKYCEIFYGSDKSDEVPEVAIPTGEG